MRKKRRIVAGMTDGGGGLTLHLEKVLHAPSERVYAACVEPESVADWFGPKGFTVPGRRPGTRGRKGTASRCSHRRGPRFT